MSELRNNDGVPIRVGQVWENASGNFPKAIIGFDGDTVVAKYLHARLVEYNGRPASDNRLSRLISCPVLGDMSEWRIVTVEEREKYPIPACAEIFNIESNIGWLATSLAGEHCWNPDCLYRVPLDFDFEAERVDIAYDEQEKFEAEKERCTCGVIHEGHPRDPCENCDEFAGNPPRTCPDCNKAEFVCECPPRFTGESEVTADIKDPQNFKHEYGGDCECNDTYELHGKTLCTDCNKEVTTGIELLDPYNRRYEPHIVKMIETINALIKRTEALT